MEGFSSWQTRAREISAVADNEDLIGVQQLFLDSSQSMDTNLGTFWNLHETRKRDILLLHGQVNSLHSVCADLWKLVTTRKENISYSAETELTKNVTALASEVACLGGLLIRMQRLITSEGEIFDTINEEANILYNSHEQMVYIYDELSRAPNVIRINSSHLSSDLSRNEGESKFDENGGMIIQHADPHLVAEFGQNILSRSLCTSNSFPSNLVAASWTKDGTFCAVCLEGFGPEGAFVLGTCGHVYHNPCLAKYSQVMKNCHCTVPLPLEYFFSIGKMARDNSV